WQFSPPDPPIRDTTILAVDHSRVDNRTLYRDVIVHVVPGVLVGHLNWEGRSTQPNARQQLPVTVTLKLGNLERNYSGITTDASGNFTLSVGDLPTGTYSWRAKGPNAVPNTNTTPG